MNSVLFSLTFGLAMVFILICIAATIRTLSGGGYSSGIHFVPSILAVVGMVVSESHFFLGAVIVILDIGSLLAVAARRQPRG